MSGPTTIPEPTLAELKPVIDKVLAPVFGPMTAEKVVMSELGIVPDWRVRGAIHKFLRGQIDIKKHEKEKSKRRQRDIDHEKFEGIVDGRTS